MDIMGSLRMLGEIRKISKKSDIPMSEIEVLLLIGSLQQGDSLQQRIKRDPLLKITGYCTRNLGLTLSNLSGRGAINKVSNYSNRLLGCDHYALTESGTKLYEEIITEMQRNSDKPTYELVEAQASLTQVSLICKPY